MKKFFVIVKKIDGDAQYLKDYGMYKPYDPESSYFKAVREIAGQKRSERGKIPTATYTKNPEEAIQFPFRREAEAFIQEQSILRGAEVMSARTIPEVKQE